MTIGERDSRPAVATARNKVPEITVWFWVIKVLTTGMGETASDYLAHTFAPPVAVGMGLTGLVVALVLQFRARRYLAGIYWLAVVMVSVFGTMAADVLHVGLGIPYTVSTVFYAVVLTVVFVVWYATERSLSITRSSVLNTRRIASLRPTISSYA